MYSSTCHDDDIHKTPLTALFLVGEISISVNRYDDHVALYQSVKTCSHHLYILLH